MADEPRLTPRQAECLEHLISGREVSAIAEAMTLAEHSVYGLCGALLRAYDVPDVRVLVARVLGERLERCERALAAIEERRGDRRGPTTPAGGSG